jgi:SAM-dependent methyltransferase
MLAEQQAITLGHPSYVWRAGQERRVELVRRYVPLEGACILDAGCGLGLYVQRFRDFSADVHGIDVDPARVAKASKTLPNIRQASAEELPYPDDTFDLVFSHEVLEHVPDDRRAVAEACRVLKPGGHLVIFCPNRWYPFETHGCYWRGTYHFGNIPLVNYLPNRWRDRLCPHVRAYTRQQLLGLLADLPGEIVIQRIIFAGYDNILARHPFWGRLLRRITYALERTPLQVLGLSHLLIYQKLPRGKA